MPREFNVIIEKGEDGYLISDVVELPGCHTQAKTIDKLMERTKEAITLYLDATKDIDTGTTFIGVKKLKV